MDINMDVYHAELRSRLRRAEEGRATRTLTGVYDRLPTVPQLFANKNVLITGASGFLGRVLLEKLLRSCPDIGTVFLLLRPKRGVPPDQRVADIVNVQLFDQLIFEQPSALSKIVAVAGDCSAPGLGLSAEDRAVLQEGVNFVFHGAASVRFDDPVEKAVNLNTRGAREVVDLCTGMRNLETLVHISTAYTNINQSITEERLYSTQIDWRDMIRAVSNVSDCEAMDKLGNKLTGFHPNTYTFSKALAEQVMGEAASSLPVIIVRPSIVIGAVKEPLVGWLDNVNSPAAIWAAFNKGLLRTSRLVAKECVNDYVPVDIVTKATILAAWARATEQRLGEAEAAADEEVPVVNVAIADVHPVPGWVMQDIFFKSARRAVPYATAIRYPWVLTSENPLLRGLTHITQHLLFGILLDLVLRITNQKPRLMKIYRKIEVTTDAIADFSNRGFRFATHKFWKLQMLMHPDDIDDFDFDLDSLDPKKDSPNQMIGILEYAFKERFDREKGLRHIDRLFWIEMGFYAVLIALVLWLIGSSYLW